MQEAIHILSYGAGVNSTALMIYLMQKKVRVDGVVFSDTGGEMPETYRYLSVADEYLKKHDVPVKTVRSMNTPLFDNCARRQVIPSQIWRWCTRDYKIAPIYRHYRSLGAHVYQYIGIAYDELERMKDSRAGYVTNVYPLVDEKITREDCEKIIEKEGLPIPVKSGCFFCPFNTMHRWHELYENHRQLYRRAMLLEESSKHFPKQRLAVPTLRGLAKSFRRRQVPQIEVYSPCGSECMT
ncbi:phosphoadenosine phosphosulfate reductase family protein [Candidatus Bathyarchaeota archaeon]|nr:phosphoadenosine phosphosulfate reductase family protein [Candidatus Bathyarchaeota archaeon]